MLPALTVNRSFMRAFIAAETPCFALGMVEVQGRPCGLFALQPEEEIPPEITDRGFSFGHSLYGSDAFEVIHLAFAFYGFLTYNALVNPNNPLVQTVLDRLIADGDYFFFALGASGRVTTFRSEIGQGLLSQVEVNRARIRQSTTTAAQYDRAVSSFARNPEPEGVLLHWVCRDRMDYLDLATDRLEMTPSS